MQWNKRKHIQTEPILNSGRTFSKRFQNCPFSPWITFLLIDWLDSFFTVSAIFQPYNGGSFGSVFIMQSIMKNQTCAWTYILCRNIIVFVPFFSLPFILWHPFSSSFFWICPTLFLLYFLTPFPPFPLYGSTSLPFDLVCSVCVSVKPPYLARTQEVDVNIVCVYIKR